VGLLQHADFKEEYRHLMYKFPIKGGVTSIQFMSQKKILFIVGVMEISVKTSGG